MTSISASQKTSPHPDMYLVAMAWMYVVMMMAVAEALSSQGTVLGAHHLGDVRRAAAGGGAVHHGHAGTQAAARVPQAEAREAAAPGPGRGGAADQARQMAATMPAGDAVAPVRKEA
jgi:hypothetical protein